MNFYLRQLRLIRELTLRDVARLTNNKISYPYLDKLENHQIKKPSVLKLYYIAKAYNVDIKTLAENAGFIPRSEKVDSTLETVKEKTDEVCMGSD